MPLYEEESLKFQFALRVKRNYGHHLSIVRHVYLARRLRVL